MQAMGGRANPSPSKDRHVLLYTAAQPMATSSVLVRLVFLEPLQLPPQIFLHPHEVVMQLLFDLLRPHPQVVPSGLFCQPGEEAVEDQQLDFMGQKLLEAPPRSIP